MGKVLMSFGLGSWRNCSSPFPMILCSLNLAAERTCLLDGVRKAVSWQRLCSTSFQLRASTVDRIMVLVACFHEVHGPWPWFILQLPVLATSASCVRWLGAA